MFSTSTFSTDNLKLVLLVLVILSIHNALQLSIYLYVLVYYYGIASPDDVSLSPFCLISVRSGERGRKCQRWTRGGRRPGSLVFR